MRRMVVGFAFTENRTKVFLIHKLRGPDVVRHKLNGIGGHIEPTDETLAAAMRREFHEEAGVDVPEDRWTVTAQMSGPGWSVDFFRTDLDREEAASVRSMTDEAVNKHSTTVLNPHRLAPHLQWLIPLSLSENVEFPIRAFERVPHV